jgi:serine protease DegS
MPSQRFRTLLIEVVTVALVVLAVGVLILFIMDPNRFQHHSVVVFEDSATSPTPAAAVTATGAVSYANAVAMAAPAVVNVFTTKVVTRQRHPFMDDPFFRRFFGENPQMAPEKRLENSLGSGVIVSTDGYILTNNHVIEGADEIRVALSDGRNTQAKVVGTDPETDLAVLKISYSHLPTAVIGRSENLRVGDVVLAIGNPFGVGQTVTQGIVSATGRSQLGISTFENFIQTDAAINPGNSGGALIDPGGHLVGVNTAIFTQSGGSQGIGFAIPSTLAKGIMKQIIENGEVIRGWLGIDAQDLSPALADSFNLKDANGAIVAGVVRGGPGDKAGIQSGDIILGVNETTVVDARDVMIKIAAVRPGTEVHLRLIRGGREQQVTVRVGQRPRRRAES